MWHVVDTNTEQLLLVSQMLHWSRRGSRQTSEARIKKSSMLRFHLSLLTTKTEFKTVFSLSASTYLQHVCQTSYWQEINFS